MRLFSKLLLVLVCLPVIAFADQTPLNSVTYQLSAEKWVSTNSAKVTVNVNASVSAQGLAQVQKTVMAKLQKIANQGKWHITQFNRSQDQSGLERVMISAQNRLPEKDLVNLRSKAKSISKPGETFKIANVDFSPSLADMEKTRATLRQDILQQAKADLDGLNKMFPNQHYVLHTVNYGGIRPAPRPMLRTMAMARPEAPALTVSNKLQLHATVAFASQLPAQKAGQSS